MSANKGLNGGADLLANAIRQVFQEGIDIALDTASDKHQETLDAFVDSKK